MRLRLLALISAATAAVTASPALAHDRHQDDRAPSWKADRGTHHGVDPQARGAWLAECRRRVGTRNSGLEGAAIGGIVGGLAGNRIAGRGDRTVGTIAGAAVGAAAGMAIDRSGDRRELDQCETYLNDYYARYSYSYGGYAGHGYPGGYRHQGYAQPAYGYGAGCCQQPMMMVPVVRQTAPEPECVETVEYEYVDVPVQSRPRPAPRKRVKVVPDKRIRVK